MNYVGVKHMPTTDLLVMD